MIRGQNFSAPISYLYLRTWTRVVILLSSQVAYYFSLSCGQNLFRLGSSRHNRSNMVLAWVVVAWVGGSLHKPHDWLPEAILQIAAFSGQFKSLMKRGCLGDESNSPTGRECKNFYNKNLSRVESCKVKSSRVESNRVESSFNRIESNRIKTKNFHVARYLFLPTRICMFDGTTVIFVFVNTLAVWVRIPYAGSTKGDNMSGNSAWKR